ncbi:unnamed protein product [Diabrotica balteata]|uniref:Uncharacterized protein n=1 Tax=Diabrotica balteata TaxID=107213 RepID=A0A9N9X8N9_DIABA|nr:unnamed protein product [Diabrotica balteata]
MILKIKIPSIIYTEDDKHVELSPGDYILASFESISKRVTVTFKYVSKIIHIFSENEYEIQGLLSLDEGKLNFKLMHTDISVINKIDIVSKLPDPQIIQDERILKIVFPIKLDIHEKKIMFHTY